MRALQRLRATVLPDPADAALLGVEQRSPPLYIQRIAYLADGALRRIHFPVRTIAPTPTISSPN